VWGQDANPPKGGEGSMRIAPWNALSERVHHDNTKCSVGNLIVDAIVQRGTGDKPRCRECARLR
jgi:hypothetical protein